MNVDISMLKQLANALRFLAIDMVEVAQSGHPGMPLGMADIALILFKEHLRFNPNDPLWEGRDRLVFSAGHGSALLYGCLHLAGYKHFDLQQLKRFRQKGSVTPGHPEYAPEHGIEATTGPLGQGLGMAAGMALAAKMMQSRSVQSQQLEQQKIFAICGDGCLAEGIGQEAISIAGHYKLNNLIVLFDDNQITIDGSTGLSTSEDHLLRAKAAGWEVMQVDGHAYGEIDDALASAKQSKKPVLIAFRTIIGFGVPSLAGSHKTHGAPLGVELALATRKHLVWPYEPFCIPQEIVQKWRSFWLRNQNDYDDWQQGNSDGIEAFDLNEIIKQTAQASNEATRVSSGRVLETLMRHRCNLVGGSADLSTSNNTRTAEHVDVKPGEYSGNYIHYGIREHVMGAMCNGIALYTHGRFTPYCGTFLVFADYLRPALRMSALMHLPVVYVFTHDSIGVGEDGPTHQPVEHLASLRLIPNVSVIRPCDAFETACAWKMALDKRSGPTVIALSRQKVSSIPRTFDNHQVEKGGYIAYQSEGDASVTICATGSEVGIAFEVSQALQKVGINSAVVSLPSIERFLQQDLMYRNRVIQPQSLKVAIEAGISFGWERIIGAEGMFFGVESFGISAPANEVFDYFELNASQISSVIQQRIVNMLRNCNIES
jgi:transketolase